MRTRTWPAIMLNWDDLKQIQILTLGHCLSPTDQHFAGFSLGSLLSEKKLNFSNYYCWVAGGGDQLPALTIAHFRKLLREFGFSRTRRLPLGTAAFIKPFLDLASSFFTSITEY